MIKELLEGKKARDLFEMAKSNKKVFSADEISDEVRSIHRNPDDFDEGDINDRIYEYAPYKLKKIKIDDLDLEEWDVQDYLVDRYVKQYGKNKKYPPIVVGIDNGTYTIIDGVHRANALNELGVKEINAYVGEK